jgi:arsenate reductase
MGGATTSIMIRKPCVLFLCTHNSARSQMAEGWLRHLAGDKFEVLSAGTEPSGLHPLAVRAMEEVDVDISGHTSKGLQGILGHVPVRYAIIVCAQASRECPRIYPALGEVLHWPFDDPAAVTGTEEAQLAGFRRVRDEIGQRLRAWLQTTPETKPGNS